MSAIRPDRNRLNSAGSFSAKYILPRSFVRLTWRRNSLVSLSPQAQTRLAFLEFYQVVRDVTVVCSSFKISRQTFYKWKNRFNPNDLSSLEDHSRAPHNPRQPQLTFQQEKRLIKLRQKKKHIRLSKLKLAILYEQKYGETISSWQIQKVIEKHRLYWDRAKAERLRTKKFKNQGKKKLGIHQVNPADYTSKDKPLFFCLDTIVLYLPWGMKRYILTAIDQLSNISLARVYKTKSSLSAFDFLLRLNFLVDGQIAAVLCDHGSEWSKHFKAACKKLKITQVFTRLRTPQDNGINERFNRTLKEEFLQTDEWFDADLAKRNLTQVNRRLTDWLICYNLKRPHQALKYQTPIHYVYYHQGVSAMYPSSTIPCITRPEKVKYFS